MFDFMSTNFDFFLFVSSFTASVPFSMSLKSFLAFLLSLLFLFADGLSFWMIDNSFFVKAFLTHSNLSFLLTSSHLPRASLSFDLAYLLLFSFFALSAYDVIYVSIFAHVSFFVSLYDTYSLDFPLLCF